MDLRAPSSSTTSSWRATSWAILLGQVGGVEVIGQAGNGVEALDDDRAAAAGRRVPRRPDAGPDRLRGRAADDRRRDAPSHIIFVTAYDQHAIEAFEVNAVDYLLKPVDPARLEVAVERARRRIASERPARARRRGVIDRPAREDRRSSSPSARAGASGWRSRSASGSCSCRPRKSSTRRWPTTALPS